MLYLYSEAERARNVGPLWRKECFNCLLLLIEAVIYRGSGRPLSH